MYINELGNKKQANKNFLQYLGERYVVPDWLQLKVEN